jgi:hypothetical protein
MNATIAKYKGSLKDLADDVQTAVNALADMGMYFGSCAKAGKFLVPVGNAYPFLMLMSKVIMGWVLLWEAGVAKTKLDGLAKAKGADPADWAKWAAFLRDDKDAAFYAGKLASAKYFIKNVLPEVDAAVKAIKSEDMSIMEISEESFAS